MENKSISKIALGIDTGGTYTDAVIYDFAAREILAVSKALTTKADLSVGILEALDALPEELLCKTQLISLSTTLATNACVEDRGGNAKLVFFGGDAKVINEAGHKYGLPPADQIYIQESFTEFSGKSNREPDWDVFEAAVKTEFEGLDGAGIIEMNAMKNSANVEKKAKQIFELYHDIPVICGHELSSELNCLQRGASTLLNARLFPVIKEFVAAIKTALSKRGISAEVVIVRSDGTLMSEDFAMLRPVETLLCGPAASVIGGAWLTAEMESKSCAHNAVVVDMGGTTTDIAIISNDEPVRVTDGVSIGKWKTFVNGLYIKTVGLGGDSAVHYADRQLILEDYRVMPLCIAAQKHPYIVDNLKRLNEQVSAHTKFLHEHFILIKDITADERIAARYTEDERALCAALKDGPLILRDAAAAVKGRDIYNLNVTRLIKEGIIQVCGLTPTDIMHIKGDFSRYSSEASNLAARFVAVNLGLTMDELCDQIYDEIKKRLYRTIVIALLENKVERYKRNGISQEVTQFIDEAYEASKSGSQDAGGILSMMFATEFTLVGIGAPIHIFLKDVANMLGTEAVIPKYFAVANALGAVVGNVTVEYTVVIEPETNAGGITGYTVFGYTLTRIFESLGEATCFAEEEAKLGALEEAKRRGATGEIGVTCKSNDNTAQSRDGNIYMGTRVIAKAIAAL